MNIRLQFASLITIGLLASFVLAIILAISYFAGLISWPFMIIATIVFNLAAWLISPYISDLIYKWFYKVEFYNYEEIKDKPFMVFVKKVCDKHNIRVPKIGIIKDQNPTAFTYGSASFNARVVLTEGLFKFLNEKELEAVIAHELGHIVNKDFIIMTIAAMLIQILYQLYVLFARSKHSAGSKGKNHSKLIIVGYVALIFYWIGTYVLLYLSRLREYYADEFSAKVTNDPNLLASALIKIGFGIASVPDTEATAYLLNTTRAQGIFDLKAAKDIALVYKNAGGKKSLLEKALLFDIVSPWARLFELNSTHPLIGKRIRRLCRLTNKPAFDFEIIIKTDVDKKILWKNFFNDFIIQYSPFFTIAAFVIVMLIQILSKELKYVFPILIIFFVLLVLFSIIKVRYKFRLDNFQKMDIINCMADVYASPVKGRPVELEGKAIGKGVAGFVFSEDMMFQDKTGIIYLNYESIMPFFGNLFFAWKKLENLLTKPAKARGWFFRGHSHHLELYNFETEEGVIKSYVRFWTIAGLALNVVIFGLLIWYVGFRFLLF